MSHVLGRCCGYAIQYALEYLGNIELQRSTAIIISYINLIVNIIMIVTNILVLEAAIAILKDDDAERHKAGVTVSAVSGVFLLLLILFLAFAIAQTVGIHQDKARHVKVFRIYGMLMSYILLPITLIVYHVNDVDATIYFIPTLISFFWYIYYLTVMKNQYRRIKEAARGPTDDITATNI